LVLDFAPDFAAWLLNVDRAAVREIHVENIELPAGRVRSDTVFHITLADERRVVLHIEFQGERSDRPMPLRMLDYMSRLTQQEWGPLCSVVIYVGDRAGVGDTGEHAILCVDGSVALAWRYRVIRLWEMQAEELLALKRPALLALVGQTRIEAPEQVLPEAVATIGRTPDAGERARLFAALTSLLRDEEMTTMVERLLEATDQGLMMDTPFLRKVRERSRAEGEAIGSVQGEARGEARGRVQELQRNILDVLAARVPMPLSQYRRIEEQVEALDDLHRLRDLLQAAALASDVADFERALAA
jgi:predicted transposase YdaD